MFYNARWYDSQLGRFAQADTIVPGGVQGYDRYAYVNNNPVNGTDPSGHDPAGNCYDKGYCDQDPDFTKIYMGGATPAEPPGFITDGPEGVYGWARLPEVASDVEGIFEMYTAGGDSTLKVYLVYQTDSDENVVGIDITIENSGASSARLEAITLTETGRLSMNTCTVNTTCRFRPDKTVETESGQLTSVKICKNCWSDNITIFNSPFYNNKNSEIKVQVSMSILWSEDGRTPNYTKVPFVYTIPWWRQ